MFWCFRLLTFSQQNKWCQSSTGFKHLNSCEMLLDIRVKQTGILILLIHFTIPFRLIIRHVSSREQRCTQDGYVIALCLSNPAADTSSTAAPCPSATLRSSTPTSASHERSQSRHGTARSVASERTTCYFLPRSTSWARSGISIVIHFKSQSVKRNLLSTGAPISSFSQYLTVRSSLSSLSLLFPGHSLPVLITCPLRFPLHGCVYDCVCECVL